MCHKKRQEALRKIRDNIGTPDCRVNFPGMTWEQLNCLANDPLMTIGGHGHEHLILTEESRETARQEIVTNKQELEAQLNQEIHIFSYPNGSRNDLIIDLLKRVGFHYAVTAKEGFVGVDPYSIRRITVRNPLSMNGYRALVSGIIYISDRIGNIL